MKTNKKIAIGGMISSGKSTLLKSLSEELQWESLEEFRKDDELFESLLNALYKGVQHVELPLQTYFIVKHWSAQQEMDCDYIVDRDIIEHWLFAEHNLSHSKELFTAYTGLFQSFMNTLQKPDIYIILDINWETFKDRVHNRGRESEVENFNKNEEYFKNLLSTYTEKLSAQCIIYDIPHVVIDANCSPDEVHLKVLREIGQFGLTLPHQYKELNDELLSHDELLEGCYGLKEGMIELRINKGEPWKK